jgi:hypothetical protein
MRTCQPYREGAKADKGNDAIASGLQCRKMCSWLYFRAVALESALKINAHRFKGPVADGSVTRPHHSNGSSSVAEQSAQPTGRGFESRLPF